MLDDVYNFRDIVAFLRKQFPVDPTEAVVYIRRRKTRCKYESLLTFSNLTTRKDTHHKRGRICFYIRVDSALGTSVQKDNLLHEWAHIHATLDALYHHDSSLTYPDWHGKIYAGWERWDEPIG